jgi:hypothetical protein
MDSREECTRMIRQWLKILVLIVGLLTQVAMSCQSGSNQEPTSAPQRGR